jgi:hypothetical protein
MIVPMLQEMREEMRAGFAKVEWRFGVVEKRLDDLLKAQVSFRQALTADTLMTRLLTGEFEERIAVLEKSVADIMDGQK